MRLKVINSNSVLIVDDEVALCELFAIYFEMEGFKVLQANSGNEAIEVLKKHPTINFIITDVKMPDGDGVFLLKYVKQNCPPELKIIMLSGFTDYPEDEFSNMGAAAFFSKPADPSALVAFVKSIIIKTN